MKAHEFVKIASAETYRINLNGEIVNSKGYPVKPNDKGIVKLTDNEGKRKDFKVSDLVTAIKTGNAVEEVAAVEQPDIPDFLKEAAPAPVTEAAVEPEAAAEPEAAPAPVAAEPEAAPAPVAAEPEAAQAPVKQKKQSKAKAAAEASEGVATEAAPAPEKKKRRAITLADVADIKAKFAAGAKRKELAEEYGIGYTYVVHLLLDDIVPKK